MRSSFAADTCHVVALRDPARRFGAQAVKRSTGRALADGVALFDGTRYVRLGDTATRRPRPEANCAAMDDANVQPVP